MQIDWITVAAQIINFLVLVWLLNRFLYGPVSRAMKAREARIAERLRAASEREEKARAEAEKYQELRARLNADREALMDEAREQAATLRKSLVAEIRAETAELRRAWQEEVEAEKCSFIKQTREQAADAFVELVRAALSDLATAEIEDMIAARFVDELYRLNADAAKRLQKAAAENGGVIRVRSTFELTPQRRKQVAAAARRVISETASVEFEQAGELTCGIELRSGSQIIRWSLDSYLDDLEARLRDAVRVQTPSESGRAAAGQR